MFDHVTIRVSDREASERFYDTVLAALGKEHIATDDEFAEWDDFSIDRRRATRRRRSLHIAFYVPTTELVDAFHARRRRSRLPGRRRARPAPAVRARLLRRLPAATPTATASRPSTSTDDAASRARSTTCGCAAPTSPPATRFYETIGPFVGFELDDDAPDRVQFVGQRRRRSRFVDRRPPTEHVHIAFAATTTRRSTPSTRPRSTPATRDNGAPGERAVYHPGYYGAFVLDPDGHNVEAVNHNR